MFVSFGYPLAAKKLLGFLFFLNGKSVLNKLFLSLSEEEHSLKRIKNPETQLHTFLNLKNLEFLDFIKGPLLYCTSLFA
jgi:hypothetical protein